MKKPIDEKILLVHNVYDKGQHAGRKFVMDISDVFKSIGGRDICEKEHHISVSYRLIKMLHYFFIFLKLLVIADKSTSVFCVYSRDSLLPKLVVKAKKIKNFKLVYIIEDFLPLRNEQFFGEPMNSLKSVDGFIVQNSVQKEYLESNLKKKIDSAEIGILDFLGIPVVRNNIDLQENRTICYGANLSYEHSGFIYSWMESNTLENVNVKVYGINLEMELNNKFEYCGSFDSNECHTKIVGDFGLVWFEEADNKSYYDFVSPHKLSMYIMAGMPVIIKSSYVSSKFVQNHNIGIVVDSLDEIENCISSISDEQYNEMVHNIEKVQKDISVGKNLESCIEHFINN